MEQGQQKMSLSQKIIGLIVLVLTANALGCVMLFAIFSKKYNIPKEAMSAFALAGTIMVWILIMLALFIIKVIVKAEEAKQKA